MKAVTFLLISLLIASPAAAGTVNGNGALALAALVGEVSPYVSTPKKRVLSKLLDGHSNFSFPSGHKISVVAKKLNCRASNVDIKSHSCELKFGAHNVAAAICKPLVPERTVGASSKDIDPPPAPGNCGGRRVKFATKRLPIAPFAIAEPVVPERKVFTPPKNIEPTWSP